MFIIPRIFNHTLRHVPMVNDYNISQYFQLTCQVDFSSVIVLLFRLAA